MPIPTNPIDKLIARLKINLGRGTSNTTINEYAIEWYNLAQKDVCKKANFWFMHTSVEIAFTAGDSEEDLPSDFKDEDSVWIKNALGEFVEIEDMDDMDYRRVYSDNTAVSARGEPSHYMITPTTLKVRPIPDDAYTIVLVYWKYLADLIETDANTNVLLDEHSELLEARTTYYGFRHLREFEAAKWWENEVYGPKLNDLVVVNADRILPGEMVLQARPDVKGSTIGSFRGRGGN